MSDQRSHDRPENTSGESSSSGSPESDAENTAGGDASPYDLTSFLEAVKAPISEEAPAGESVTYDEDFQTLKTEIDKISAASGQANYERITELARTILTEKSKDLRAAGYLVVGEARANGTEEMFEAIRAVWLLIDTYWEDLYPAKRRMRGRGSALQFISDRLADWISAADFQQSDREALVTTRDLLQDIQEFGLEEMGEHAPSLSGLLGDLDDVIDSLPEPEPDEPPSESAQESDSESATTEDDTFASGTAPRDPSEFTSESDASAAVSDAASFLREQDLTDPTPFRLLRAVQWGVLQEEPPSENGETRLPAPREQRRTYLTGLLDDDEYEALIREGESSFQNEPFHLWLDLQRLVASALDALGAPYEPARDAVLFDVARLVNRLPGLLSLTFSDGTPFASPLTVDWIETQVQPMLSTGDDQEAASNGDGRMLVTEQYEEARQLLSGGELDEALTLMREGTAKDTSEREAFHRRLYVALLCMKGNRLSVARPLLDRLDAKVERHALDSWRPSLALKVWEYKCRCYDELAQNARAEASDDLSAKADAAFEKICRLDATKALSIAEQRPDTSR